jgi:regulator of sigma E protease
MEILVKTAQFLLSLSILIIIHEMGHFLLARLFKTRVEKFYLFFNPWFSLFKKKIGETEYGIGWLPLGGYVKISGMIDESMDKEQLAQPPQPYEFRSKPSWQRLLIMMGGVFVNFVFALFVYVLILYTWGEKYLPVENMTYGIMVDSTAMNMGLRNGDKILSLDGTQPENFQSIVHDIVVLEARSIEVERNNQKINLEVNDDAIAPLLKSTFPILPRVPFYIEGVQENSPASKSGLMAGDRIIGINDYSVRFFDEFKTEIQAFIGKEVSIKALRNETDTVAVNLVVPETGIIGVAPDFDFGRYFELKEVDYSFAASIPAGINKGFRTVSSYVKQLKLLFKPETKAYESIGGFIKIGSIFSSVWDWQSFWSMTAFLSIILAVMNMLPIPALDGGHVMFLLYEIISGRKPGDKFMEYAQIAGMILLFGLLFYANGNDIVQLFKK